MKFTDFFIRRPVFASVVSLVILLAGLQSIRSLNVRQYPRSDIAVVNVKTRYIGASADLVRGFVTTPLEREEVKALFLTESREPSVADFSAVRTLRRYIGETRSAWLIELLQARRLTMHFQPIVSAADTAAKLKNWSDVWKHYDALIATDKKVFGDIAVKKYRTMLVDAQDASGASAWGNELVLKYSEDAVTLEELTRLILSDSTIKDRDYALALAAAVQMQVYSNNDAASIALVAEVVYHSGDMDRAVALQQDAWMASEPSQKAEYRRVLDTYRKAAKKSATAKLSSDAPAADVSAP